MHGMFICTFRGGNSSESGVCDRRPSRRSCSVCLPCIQAPYHAGPSHYSSIRQIIIPSLVQAESDSSGTSMTAPHESGNANFEMHKFSDRVRHALERVGSKKANELYDRAELTSTRLESTNIPHSPLFRSFVLLHSLYLVQQPQSNEQCPRGFEFDLGESDICQSTGDRTYGPNDAKPRFGRLIGEWEMRDARTRRLSWVKRVSV
jgi:hypothetical protein